MKKNGKAEKHIGKDKESGGSDEKNVAHLFKEEFERRLKRVLVESVALYRTEI